MEHASNLLVLYSTALIVLVADRAIFREWPIPNVPSLTVLGSAQSTFWHA